MIYSGSPESAAYGHHRASRSRPLLWISRPIFLDLKESRWEEICRVGKSQYRDFAVLGKHKHTSGFLSGLSGVTGDLECLLVFDPLTPEYLLTATAGEPLLLPTFQGDDLMSPPSSMDGRCLTLLSTSLTSKGMSSTDTCLSALRSHLTSKTNYLYLNSLSNALATVGWSRLNTGSPLTPGPQNIPFNYTNLKYFANINIASLCHQIYLVSLSCSLYREVSRMDDRRPQLPKAIGRTSEEEGKRKIGLGLGLARAYRIIRVGRVIKERIKKIPEEYSSNISGHSVNSKQKQTKKINPPRSDQRNQFNTKKSVEYSELTFDLTFLHQARRHLSPHSGKLPCQISNLFPTLTPAGNIFYFPLFFRKITTISYVKPSPLDRSIMSNDQTNDRPFSPPSFHNFGCTHAQKERKDNDKPSNSTKERKDTEHEAEILEDTQEMSKRESNLVTPPEKTSEPDGIPTKDITNSDDTQGPSSSVLTTNTTENHSRTGEHLCIHKNLSESSVSASRHDQEEVSPRSDQTSVYDLEPGMILDKENEGDAELLRKCASGVSNITGDLDLLRSTHSVNDHQGKNESGNPKQPDIEPEPEKNPTHDAKPEPKKNLSQEHPEEKGHEENSTKNIETEEDIKKTLERERLYMEEVMKQTDEQHAAYDQAYKRSHPDPSSSSDESHTYSLTHSPDVRGQAGLDPNVSAEWVPSFIDPELNLSKSKKRRRRQQKKKEALKDQDNLGKLLSGRQTKEDEEYISTFDLGNQARRHNPDEVLNRSGVFGGNLQQKKKKIIQDCDDEKAFAATMNSTRYGPDFDDSDSQLREGSGHEEVFEEEAFEKNESGNSVQDEPKPNEEDKVDGGDDSISSNSTGARRKQRRNKKTANKQTKIDTQTGATGQENTGRETRSRAQSKQQATTKGDDIKDAGNSKNKNDMKSKNDNEEKGEKEKNTTEQNMGTEGSTALSLLPSPSRTQLAPTDTSAACTRLDIQRVVSKAVNKAKFKTSNNFAFNSKIQNFKITTDGNKVKKFPVIDDNTPVVEVSIPEFIWADQERTMDKDNMVNVKAKGVIQFVILVRNGHLKKESWDTPKVETVRDFASYLLCTIAELKLEFGTVLRWTNAWGNVAVMGLDSSNLEMLQKFRTFFTSLRYVHQYFNTFPKDALTNNFSLSILLRSDLREFREDYLAEALFARNNLVGILETLQAESFTASDTTRAGVSKKGWRNVTLEGDADFFQSLSNFTANHWFNIGPGTVQIHGGDRRAETPEEIEAKNKRRRFNMPVGQTLTQAAKTSINQSFLRDQQALIQAKKQRNAAPASTSPIFRAAHKPASAPPSTEK